MFLILFEQIQEKFGFDYLQIEKPFFWWNIQLLSASQTFKNRLAEPKDVEFCMQRYHDRFLLFTLWVTQRESHP